MKKIIFGLILSISIQIAATLDAIPAQVCNFAAGGAFLSGQGQSHAALINPAMLSEKNRKTVVSVENSAWFVDTRVQQVSVAMCRWNVGLVRLIDSSIDGRDANKESIPVDYSESAAYVGYGFDFMGESVGFTLKHHALNAKENKSYQSLDMGWRKKIARELKIAVLVKNLYYNGDKDDQVFEVFLGGCYSLKDMNLHVKYNSRFKRFDIGAHYTLKAVELLAGMDEDANVSAGINVKLGGLDIQYAFKNVPELGNVNRVGILMSF